MKYFLYFLFYTFLEQSALGQNLITQKQLDSLITQLPLTKIDTVKFELHMRIGIAMQFINPVQAVQEFKSAMQIARDRNDTPRTMFSISTLAYTYLETGENSKSIEMLQEMLKFNEKTGTDPSYALAIIGKNYEAQGDFQNALVYTRKSFLSYEKILKEKMLVDPRGYTAGPLQVGLVFEKLHQLDSALFYAELGYQRIMEKPMEPGMEYFYCQICNLLGTIYSQQQKPIDAFRYFQMAYGKAKEVNYLASILESDMGLAKYFDKVNQHDSALRHANLAYELAIQLKRFDIMKESSMLMRSVYEKQGNYAMALSSNDRAIAARDSVTGAAKIREVASLTYKEEMRQEKRIQEIEAGKIAYRNKVKLYSLVGILCGLILLASILYRNNRQKHKANTLLQEQKDEVHKAMINLKATQLQLIQSEKMASLGQLTAGIAHEIQNPLNFVNNFSEINVELMDELKIEREKSVTDNKSVTEDEIINDISQNLKKIILYGKRADGIVKGMLQHSKSSSGTKEETDINSLTEEYLRLSYHGFKGKDTSQSEDQSGFNVTMKTDFDQNLGKIEIIPQDIGRVLLNLYNNAFYAIKEKMKKQNGDYEPIVTVSTKRIDHQPTNAGKVEITISDNGIGIPENIGNKIFQPFFTTKPTGQGTGLGLSLSYDIIKAHGGELKVNSIEGQGTTFVISLPV